MKKLLRNHSTSVLAVLASVFLAAVIVGYVWGISFLIFEVNKANENAAASAPPPQFDLSAAASLDYRGISTSTLQ